MMLIVHRGDPRIRSGAGSENAEKTVFRVSSLLTRSSGFGSITFQIYIDWTERPNTYLGSSAHFISAISAHSAVNLLKIVLRILSTF